MTLRFLLIWVVGCAAPLAGTSVERPEPGPAQRTATTGNGVRVLLNGRVQGSRDGAWMATTPRQLRRLWSRVGGRGPAPEVDFETHVVLGAGFEDGPCQGEISAVEVDARGFVTMKVEPLADACIALAVRVGVLVAVPRSVLPESFVWAPRRREPWVRRFELPPYSGEALHEGPPSTLERDSLEEELGEVELPALGNISLRTLTDGRQVWVAHHQDGTVGVVAADRPLDDHPLRRRTLWDSERGRFRAGHDALGRSVTGGDPLPTHAYRRIDESHIAIGPLAALAEGPIVPRSESPSLEGAEAPYEEVRVAPLEALPNGQIVRVEAELVFGIESAPRVCVPPEDRKLRAHFLGCGDSGWPIAGARAEERGGVTNHFGPLIVRRRGDALDLIIGMGGGLAGGVRDYRIQPPAPRGETRERGRLPLSETVEGDTSGARDGFRPSCVAAPGGPDESWTLVSPRAQRVAVEIEAEHDPALAIVGANGEVLDCNDDRHGHYFSSIVHVDLQPNVPVRVIVDAFGGASGPYRLRVRPEATLPNGGVLELGQALSADTSQASDDESAGCTARGPDQTYRFEVTEHGRYRFTVDAPGWSPILALNDGERNRGCRVGRDRVESDYVLEPGTYRVVVDGPGADDMGAYRLRAERLSE